MLKTRTIIEIEVKGRDYRFECSPDAPLADVYEAITVMNNYITGRLQQAQEQPEVKQEEV